MRQDIINTYLKGETYYENIKEEQHRFFAG